MRELRRNHRHRYPKNDICWEHGFGIIYKKIRNFINSSSFYLTLNMWIVNRLFILIKSYN